MSRALDKDVAASLGTSSAAAAYEAISQALDPRGADGLLEIEILGRRHEMPPGTHVLRDAACLGVSKVSLVQAFIVARQILKAEMEKAGQAPDEQLSAATAVILLMDPEHLTAANTRKRLIQTALSGSGAHEIEHRLRIERLVIDSLLTSPLHRHTKSPTLWSHRRWLVSLYCSLNLSVDVLGDILEIITVAGERHPRNYYAWSHARWLMTLNVTVHQEKLLLAIKDWCLRHHSDTSGWSFLSFLVSKHVPSGATATSDVFGEVLRLTTNLRWTNESVWVFLQTLAASSVVGGSEYTEFQTACEDAIQATQDSADRRRLEASLSWCETYRAKA